MAQCSVRSCETCESSPGRRFCMDCEQFFCKACELSENANAEVKTLICEQHQEKFTYYCNTYDAASKTQPRLDKEVKSAEGSISGAKQQIVYSRLTLKNFEDETDKAKREIVGRVVLIVNALDATKYAYLKSVEKHRLKEVQKMNQEIIKIEKETENGVEVLDKMKSSIDGQKNIILMDAVSNMMNT
ncbi:unnamed protein product [Mytilus coruscus]|uniref:B box-type domain-containing protein n=1 Tax=Mytilus coruscus TaxID=42192 RepID=A0A6J8ECU3_MYTCO|nr:unnamed protein product [Mytilus coruscus]